MRVIRAQTAGFCMGVSLALKKLEAALEQKPGAAIRTLGPIIHNPQVLAEFTRRGVVCLADAAAARREDHVLIRAHGIPRLQEEWLRERCRSVADATCPRVKKAQLGIAAATASGQTLLLFGEAAHPEVAGLISYAQGPAFVFGTEAELDAIPMQANGLVLASQTTQDRIVFERLASKLAVRHPGLNVLNTICDATRKRQQEALAIAQTVDAMVVVGGRDSGNTRRLAKLAAEAGIRTFHVESIEELDPDSLKGAQTAGLTAGASTPGYLIKAAQDWLEVL